MTAPLIISVSGLRGEIGKSLTLDVAIRYALAYSASVTDPGFFVITRDGRRSGAMFADAIHAALNAVGRSTFDGGVAATPTTGILIREYKAAGGIQISASHNPRQFNGLKLFSAEGRVIPKKEGEKVLPQYEQLATQSPVWADVEQLGKRILIEDTCTAHKNSVLATVDVDLIRSRQFRVLLDSNHGAGSLLGRQLLESLGCEVVLCGETPDGDFEHTPEPTAENLVSIQEKVRSVNAVVGFCQDPDADRLALIDAAGVYPGEEYTTALCAKNRLQKINQAGPVLVVNCASSRMTTDIAEEFGGQCFQSPVGEANVVDLMKAKNAVFGGEGNGGPIDPEVGFVRDSFVGIAQILEAMARRNMSLSQLVAELPKYAIVKQKMTFPLDQVPAMLDKLAQKFSDLKLNRQDGLRIDWPDSWVLIRASNTEPIIRIIAEAPDEVSANKLCGLIRESIGQ